LVALESFFAISTEEAIIRLERHDAAAEYVARKSPRRTPLDITAHELEWTREAPSAAVLVAHEALAFVTTFKGRISSAVELTTHPVQTLELRSSLAIKLLPRASATSEIRAVKIAGITIVVIARIGLPRMQVRTLSSRSTVMFSRTGENRLTPEYMFPRTFKALLR